MFNSKKIEQLEKRVEIIEARKELIVECKVCGCLLREENAKVVENSYTGIKSYYCGVHKPPYDEIALGFDREVKYYKKEVQVDKKGKPIK